MLSVRLCVDTVTTIAKYSTVTVFLFLSQFCCDVSIRNTDSSFTRLFLEAFRFVIMHIFYCSKESYTSSQLLEDCEKWSIPPNFIHESIRNAVDIIFQEFENNPIPRKFNLLNSKQFIFIDNLQSYLEMSDPLLEASMVCTSINYKTKFSIEHYENLRPLTLLAVVCNRFSLKREYRIQLWKLCSEKLLEIYSAASKYLTFDKSEISSKEFVANKLLRIRTKLLSLQKDV